MGPSYVPHHHLLSLGDCPNAEHAYAFLLADRHGHLHPLVVPLLKCQARKTLRQTIRCPTLSLPPPDGPSILVSVDYFGSQPITPWGNAYIIIFTDRLAAALTCTPRPRSNSPHQAPPPSSSITKSSLGMPRYPPFRQWPPVFLQTLPRPLRAPRHPQDHRQRLPSMHNVVANASIMR